MTRNAIIAAALTLSAALVVPTVASASVDSREHEQRQRIREGRQSGELTRYEAHRLLEQQARIHREERRYRRDDGRLDARERADLWRDQNRASRSIYLQKHD